jgi:hypothetical protein
MTWAGCVAHKGEMKSAYKPLFGNPDDKNLLGRTRHVWEDNMKMDLKDIGY